MMTTLEGSLSANASIAPLVNDLGGVPALELAIVAHAAVKAVRHREVRFVFGPNRLMKSLDMKGFSLTALPLNDPDVELALISPVGPRASPNARRPRRIHPIPLCSSSSARVMRRATTRHGDVLSIVCETLNREASGTRYAGRQGGRRHTGTTLAAAARTVLGDLDALPFADASKLFSARSDGRARVMGGSSSVLLAITAEGRGDDGETISAKQDGLVRMQEYGGAKLGDRTMLDAWSPALDALAAANLEAAAQAAETGAAATASMKTAGAGRSSYVPSAVRIGILDRGALAVAAVFHALASR